MYQSVVVSLLLSIFSANPGIRSNPEFAFQHFSSIHMLESNSKSAESTFQMLVSILMISIWNSSFLKPNFSFGTPRDFNSLNLSINQLTRAHFQPDIGISSLDKSFFEHSSSDSSTTDSDSESLFRSFKIKFYIAPTISRLYYISYLLNMRLLIFIKF